MAQRDRSTGSTTATSFPNVRKKIAREEKKKKKKLTGVAGEFLPKGIGEALGARQGRKTGEQAAQSRGDVRSVFVLRVVHRLLGSSRPRALHLFSRVHNQVCNGDNFWSVKIRRLLGNDKSIRQEMELQLRICVTETAQLSLMS